MQGLITLDFGNSHPHAGLFHKTQNTWQLIKVVPWKEINLYLDQLGMTPNNTSMVLCEVKAREEELLPLIHQGYLLTRVKDYWKGSRFAGMPVHYATSLGEDRLILAHYCYKKEKAPTLIIDAGTYVTMDIVNEAGFQGGYILPGPDAYKSSFQKGEQLKEVLLAPEFSEAIPKTTVEAMSWSYSAFLSFAREIISKYQISKIILTGGKSSLWSSSLSVQEQPDLIHLALHHWMTTQIEPL